MTTEKIEYMKLNKEKFEIAINDMKRVISFLKGISLGLNNSDYSSIDDHAIKLSNAVQWLHNWGDDVEVKKDEQDGK